MNELHQTKEETSPNSEEVKKENNQTPGEHLSPFIIKADYSERKQSAAVFASLPERIRHIPDEW